MLNRRQFGTYLGLTFVGLATGWLALRREKPFIQRFIEGLRVTHIHPDPRVQLWCDDVAERIAQNMPEPFRGIPFKLTVPA